LLSTSEYRISKEKKRMGYGAEHKYMNGFPEETRRKMERPKHR